MPTIAGDTDKNFSAKKQLERFWARLPQGRLPGDMRPEIERNLTTLTLAAAFDEIRKIGMAPAARKPALRRRMREEFDIKDDADLLAFVDGVVMWRRKQQ